MKLRRVILETPYAGKTKDDIAGVEENVKYARLCLHDCLIRGDAPIASYLLYTQPTVLDDTIPEERALGIQAGLEWGSVAEATVVYSDRGISGGMRYGIERAWQENRPIHVRTLPHYRDKP